MSTNELSAVDSGFGSTSGAKSGLNPGVGGISQNRDTLRVRLKRCAHKIATVRHLCINCRQPTTRPKFCSPKCGNIHWVRHNRPESDLYGWGAVTRISADITAGWARISSLESLLASQIYEEAQKAVNNCDFCGTEYVPVLRKQRFCSRKCCNAVHLPRSTRVRPLSSLDRRRLAKAFKAESRAVWVYEAGYAAMYYQAYPTLPRCVVCSSEFQPIHPAQLCCTPVCGRRRERRRSRSTPASKIKRAVRRRFKKVVKQVLAEQGLEWQTISGCTVARLRRHIERQFKPGMTWENYGGTGFDLDRWHIDHIRPCADFDLSSPDEVRACFHYTNLRPMWALENHAKSCHRIAS